jgi:transposase
MPTLLEARLAAELTALRAQNQAQQIEIRLLKEKIDLLVRRIFGRSSEQLDDGQLMLLLQGDDGAKKAEASSASPGALEAEIEQRGKENRPVKPRKEREARVPERLPAVDEVIEPEEVAARLKTGGTSARRSPNSSTTSPHGSCAAASSAASM